ncbi:PepSY domain-containing protein [Psychroserpens ponticola]|uniref:PepSY domain-containing protein n=1 Tax=Psychroserpens ponticola TaxID=2932268 RepID=A0ABY7RZV5_9FLAO|nr:PepSY domain-containing protein [Psychroserpens ponticola]WCO02669.1 PepSY domain-containing protein [Psychroserpens ponticola]
MTISIWRFSHLILALVSSVFIILASVTGMILAFEPISNQMQSYGFNEDTTVAATVKSLSKRYDEIITVEIDENDFVIASVITNEGKSDTFYINPETGEKLGSLIEKAPIFSFAINLHRSLFLKSTGRFIVGLVSFFLILMAFSGMILIAKRQGGIRRYFSKVINENFEQYYHVVLGRWILIPIVIVAFTGVYLSLEKFSLLPETKISHEYPELSTLELDKIPISDFEVFKSLKLTDVKRLEFPFSEDVEDYFFIKLKDKELLVNQYSGVIVSEQKYPLVQLVSQWSLFLHTGQGTILWSIVLFLVCVTLLFFIYSGFAMTLKRRKNTNIPKNKFTQDTSEIIILVGSETGSTFRFASLFYEALITQGKSVFISEMNSYTNYQQAKQILIFTSTYGEGDAPINANRFKHLVTTIPQNKTIDYAIVGYGSLLYPDYCKFAETVDDVLKSHQGFQQSSEVFKINNQSFETFQIWVNQWSTINNVQLQVKQPSVKLNSKNTREFKVVKRTDLNCDQTFILQLKPNKKETFHSGDLLAFRPDDNQAVRYYSVAKIGDDVLLSIKKHEKGLCSSYLSTLKVNDLVSATVKPNSVFHVPKSSKAVVMIANGTGIAPFLGMIGSNLLQKEIHLFLGLRTKTSFELYSTLIENALNQSQLKTCQVAYSQEQKEKIYVQDLIAQQADFIATHLKNEGVIMICGSIVMQNQVLKQLRDITSSKLNVLLSEFEANSQIKMDCY